MTKTKKTRLTPSEMSALALLAYSEGLRRDIRVNIAETLVGDARLIALTILGIKNPEQTETHRAAAAQLQDWALRLQSVRKKGEMG